MFFWGLISSIGFYALFYKLNKPQSRWRSIALLAVAILGRPLSLLWQRFFMFEQVQAPTFIDITLIHIAAYLLIPVFLGDNRQRALISATFTYAVINLAHLPIIYFILFLLCFFSLFCASSCYYFDENSIHSPFSQFWQAEMEYDDSVAIKTLNVAAVSLDNDSSPEINRNKILTFIDRITSEQPNVRLMLFPETALGYYHRPSNPGEYQRSVAETIPGETTNALSLKAIEYQIYVSLGMTEKSGDVLYNSQVLIGPDGSIVSVHRKNYLTIQDYENGFKAGQGIVVDMIDGIKVATIICRDSNSFDVNKKIHASKAELVLLPLADAINPLRDLLPHHYTYTWVLGTNRSGNEDGIH